MTLASSGNSTISHPAGELFKAMADVIMVHVLYRGGGPTRIDLIAGQMQLDVANMLSALPLAKTGKLRVRGISTAARSRAMPELPTIAEAGVPGFEGVQWNGVFRAYWDAARYHRASQSRHRSTSAAAGYTRAYPC